MFNAAQMARLSVAQRHILVRHVELDIVPFRTHIAVSVPTRSLLERGLLRPIPALGPTKVTRLTVKGREVACQVLAEYAECLIRAGAGRTPLETLLSRKGPDEIVQELKKIIGEIPDPPPEMAQASKNIKKDALLAKLQR